MMLPLLVMAGDGLDHSLAEARDHLATVFSVSAAERSELLPSGRQSRFDNRVAWARSYIGQAALLTAPKRGYFRITGRGLQVLSTSPPRIDIGFLEQFEEFREFRSPTSITEGTQVAAAASASDVTPEETLEQAYANIRSDLGTELLNRVKAASPKFFESLVVELLLGMGYGRSRADAGRAIGASGDEGIDGIISEDRLGLDTIYIQAKKWEGTVGRPEIQKFVGALHGKRARKGVFITTGAYSAEVKDYVGHIDPRVVLIDGRALTEYMIDLGIGVSTRATYELKRMDSDYFDDEG
jgi:restriction system protein